MKYRIGDLVEQLSIKCGITNCESVSGVNIDKRFIPSKNVGADTSNYLIVPDGCFAFNLMHVGRDEKIPVAMNDTGEDVIVSSAYFVFRVCDEAVLYKEYFYMLMSTTEFDRYAWFCTDSSVRGNLDWGTFCDIEINLPKISIQKKFADTFMAIMRNENYRTQIGNVAPILIKGSLEEASA
jgi:type I restriction enzyme S subunit